MYIYIYMYTHTHFYPLMTVIKVIRRACKPEEFLFQFRHVYHWSLPHLPWENCPDACIVQHLNCCSQTYPVLESLCKAMGSACPHRRNGVVGSGIGSAELFPSVPALLLGAFGRGSAVSSRS